MKGMEFLEYIFIFDPSTTWSHLYDFEKDLADFFASKGFEAETIRSIKGQLGKGVLYVKKKDKVEQRVLDRIKQAEKDLNKNVKTKGPITKVWEKERKELFKQ